MENNGESTFMVNPHSQSRLRVRSEVSTTTWDYLTTFKPPAHLSLDAGHSFFEIIELSPGNIEFEFVANLFTSTFYGRKQQAGRSPLSNFPPGTFNVNNYGNAGFGAINLPQVPQPALIGGVPGQGRGKITKIEKVYNCVVYEKFITEFKRMLKKYPNFKIEDILKHLFHGTRETAPNLIYETETGFDQRFSNSGMYGRGIYFADNSQYSSAYGHAVGRGGF